MKKTVIVILIILSLLIASSCSAPNTIEVTSKDYPKLTKMEPEKFDFEEEMEREIADLNDENFVYRVCYLTVEDDSLRVENNVDYFRTTQEETFNFGYLVGVNIGEFDGWVRWFPYHTSHYPEGESPKSILLSKENYSFIIKEDNDNAFIVCEIPTFGVNKDGETSGETIVYDFDVICDKNDGEARYDISCTEIARFAGAVTAYYLSEEDRCIYFATDMSIVKMTFDGKTEELVWIDYFHTIGVNSIVKFEGELYCGSARGIYRFNPETGESLWYPMDYEKYVENP